MLEAAPEIAMCPEHAGVPAVGTCARCGRFGCEHCLLQLNGGTCRPCHVRSETPYSHAVLQPLRPRDTLTAAWTILTHMPGLVFASAALDLTFASSSLMTGRWSLSSQDATFTAVALVPAVVIAVRAAVLGLVGRHALAILGVRADPRALYRLVAAACAQAALAAVLLMLAVSTLDTFHGYLGFIDHQASLWTAALALPFAVVSDLWTLSAATGEATPLVAALRLAVATPSGLVRLLILEAVGFASRAICVLPLQVIHITIHVRTPGEMTSAVVIFFLCLAVGTFLVASAWVCALPIAGFFALNRDELSRRRMLGT